MTGLQVAELRKGMGLTAEEFAMLCGVATATVFRWESCLKTNTPPMVGSTARVFLILRGSTRADRARVARFFREEGWRAAWSAMFGFKRING